MMTRKNQALIVALLALVVGAGIASFYPGVSGSFVFDDKPNLRPLGENGGVTSVDDFKAFVFRKRAPERLLTLASFLLHDYTWPTEAKFFKLTNLLLHVLNGLLIFILGRTLARRFIQNEHHAQLTALLCTAIWLLHPIHLSTTMLVIQRLVLLSGTFIVGGLGAYVYGRSLIDKRPWAGLVVMSLGIGLGGLLGVLSKGTGVLIVLYALAIEYWIIRTRTDWPAPPYWRTWLAVFVVAPLGLLLAYIALNWGESAAIYASRRDFTVVERLLTESRVLFAYLHNILTVNVSGIGIYHDDFTISRSLIQPWTTLPAVAGILAVAGGSFAWRRRYPLLTFGVIWFLAGHSLESTFLHLELYFDHRNYLPMLGPIFAGSVALVRFLRESAFAYFVKVTAVIAVISVILIEVGLSYQSAKIWGNERLFATVTVAENPTSIRAQQTAAQYWFGRAAVDKALSHLDQAAEYHPEALDMRLQRIYILCVAPQTDVEGFSEVVERAADAHFSFAIFSTLDALNKQVEKDECAGLEYQQLDDLIAALLDNERFTAKDSYHAELWRLRANIAKKRRHLNPTIYYLDKAFALNPQPSIALTQATNLITAGLPEPALEYIEKAKEAKRMRGFRERLFRRQYTQEIQRLTEIVNRMLEER